MMDNLEQVLGRLFRRVPVGEILSGDFRADDVKKSDFVQIMRSYSNQYSDTELKNLFEYLTTSFYEMYHSAEQNYQKVEKLNVYELLRYYAGWILKIEDNEIVCEYSKFLHWRMVTRNISEDLLVTSYLAQLETRSEAERKNFSWKTCITHNNRTLHKILDQGIAENHSHFKGAGPNFELSWVHMMNCLKSAVTDPLKEIESSRRNVNVQYKPSYHEDSMEDRLLLAAFIRMILFYVVSGRREKLKEKTAGQGENRKNTGEQGGDCFSDSTEDFFCSAPGYLIHVLQDPSLMWMKKRILAETIATLRDSAYYEPLPDYAISAVGSRNGDPVSLVFQGERCLLYRTFRMIYSGDRRIAPYIDLFYAYLVIRENFRSEIAQTNDSVGFENFSVYEQRKDAFLDDFFEHAAVRKAFEASIFESNVVVSEQRIAPKDTAEKLKSYIQKMDARADAEGKYRNRFFYTVHFIKRPDNSVDEEGLTCRHAELREQCRIQALALAQFRQNYPEMAGRIKGIDAANQEIGCGPEVFAQTFRFLSRHIPVLSHDSKKSIPQLRITYHVGEDFLDLISGLRAIEEAVCFLGLRCGDRLGHALALGVDVVEWYRGKNNRLLLSQQEYIDNLAWMYHFASILSFPGQERVLSYLKREFDYYFHMVYGAAIDTDYLDEKMRGAARYFKGTEWENYFGRGNYNFGIENYYNAWKLRGDAPELYKNGYFANRELQGETVQSYLYYGVNRHFPTHQNQRYFREAGLLYYLYHYSASVRKEGRKKIEKKMSPQFVACASLIQKEIQRRIANRGIGIETNPTSNFSIGTFKRYDKHPITRFYNQGLVEDHAQLQACPQLEVSINTDDAGVFITSLENEYAYMALALEKARDEDGKPLYKKQNVYTWIDNVRKMGLRQTFMTDDEFKVAVYEWEQERGRLGATAFANAGS